MCRDADLDRAARGIVWGAFVNAGQTCASVERVYVEEPVAEAFLAKVARGDPEAPARRSAAGRRRRRPDDPGAAAARSSRSTCADAVAKGARVLTGGRRARRAPASSTRPPCSRTWTTRCESCARRPSGPCCRSWRCDSLDEAMRLANDSDVRPHGQRLDAQRRRRRERLQRELQAGVVTINDRVSSFGEPGAPYGGVQVSGIGRTHGAPRPARDGAGRSTSAATAAAGPSCGGTPTARDFDAFMAPRRPRRSTRTSLLRTARAPARPRRASRALLAPLRPLAPPRATSTSCSRRSAVSRSPSSRAPAAAQVAPRRHRGLPHRGRGGAHAWPGSSWPPRERRPRAVDPARASSPTSSAACCSCS